MELMALRDPYATVWVAVFEPVILQWMGFTGLANLETQLIVRGRQLPQGTPKPTIPGSQPLPPRPGGASPTPGGGVVTRATRQKQRQDIRELFARPDLTTDILITELKRIGVPAAIGPEVRRELSPIGIAHLFRQLYFDAGAGVGPIENVLGIAPKEELEVLEKRSRRRTYERIEEFGTETTSESSVEDQVTDEVSESVQSSLAHDMNVAVSAEASGSVAVVSASSSMSLDYGQSSEMAREVARRHMVTQTRRSVERVQRSHQLVLRTQEEAAEEFLMRRVIRNDGDAPVNYSLRRVQRRVRVKLQSMGPRLVWQLYLCNPGQQLRKSRLVMFREADPVTVPDQIPGAPPRPQDVEENGSLTITPTGDQITINLPRYADRDLRAVTVLEIMDASPGKDPDPPSVTGPGVLDAAATPNTYTFPIDAGSAERIVVNYLAQYQPSANALATWSAAVQAAAQQYEQARLEEQFERAKRLIEARHRVRPRAAADLRDEERYEILRRMVAEGFRGRSTAEGPAPVEIELFHRYFDLAAMFYYVHPSWWRPRPHTGGEDYEVTDESLPAAYGSSLGWMLQLDGDRRRNEFLNSPWVRVGIPMRPGLERGACDWLAEHVEGKLGFSLDQASPTAKLLARIERQRAQEKSAQPGPDFVTLDGQIAPGAEQAADTWPVVDEFEILEPTQGFVLEQVTIG
jgi:hypothetical protein